MHVVLIIHLTQAITAYHGTYFITQIFGQIEARHGISRDCLSYNFYQSFLCRPSKAISPYILESFSISYPSDREKNLGFGPTNVDRQAQVLLILGLISKVQTMHNLLFDSLKSVFTEHGTALLPINYLA